MKVAMRVYGRGAVIRVLSVMEEKERMNTLGENTEGLFIVVG